MPIGLESVPETATVENDAEARLNNKRWKGVSYDEAIDTFTALLHKAEAILAKHLNEMSAKDPGDIDQAILLAAQKAVQQYGLTSNAATNLVSAISSSLKSIVQNIRG